MIIHGFLFILKKHNSDYVQSSWKITEIVIKKLNKFIATENKKLIIVGIDNAFTVDNDVRKMDRWNRKL